MRMSVIKTDSGYENWISAREAGRIPRVLLDGVEQRDVVIADEEAGLVLKNMRDADGNIVLNERRNAVVRTALYGHVRIE